jgi:hypothetical protein
MTNERRQVNEQKQDGKIQTTSVVKAKPSQNLLNALAVVKLIFQSFMLTKMAKEQTANAKNVTKKLAMSAGIRVHQLIVGLPEPKCTVLKKNSWLVCMKNKMGNVRSVVKYQNLKEDYMSIIATPQGLFVGFCATDVTLASAL